MPEDNTPSLIGASVRSVKLESDYDAASYRSPSRSSRKYQVDDHKDEHEKNYTSVNELADEGALLNDEHEYEGLLDNSGKLKQNVSGSTVIIPGISNESEEQEINFLKPVTPPVALDESHEGLVVVDIQKKDRPDLAADTSAFASPYAGGGESKGGSSASIYELKNQDSTMSLAELIDSQIASMSAMTNDLQKSISDKKTSRSRSRPRMKSNLSHSILPHSVIENDSLQQVPAGAREGMDSPLIQSRSQSAAPSDVKYNTRERPHLARGDSYIGVTNDFEARTGRAPDRIDTLKSMRAGSRDYLRSVSRSRSRVAHDVPVTNDELVNEGALISDEFEHSPGMVDRIEAVVEEAEDTLSKNTSAFSELKRRSVVSADQDFESEDNEVVTSVPSADFEEEEEEEKRELQDVKEENEDKEIPHIMGHVPLEPGVDVVSSAPLADIEDEEEAEDAAEQEAQEEAEKDNLIHEDKIVDEEVDSTTEQQGIETIKDSTDDVSDDITEEVTENVAGEAIEEIDVTEEASEAADEPAIESVEEPVAPAEKADDTTAATVAGDTSDDTSKQIQVEESETREDPVSVKRVDIDAKESVSKVVDGLSELSIADVTERLINELESEIKFTTTSKPYEGDFDESEVQPSSEEGTSKEPLVDAVETGESTAEKPEVTVEESKEKSTKVSIEPADQIEEISVASKDLKPDDDFDDIHEPTKEEIIEMLKDEPVYIYTSLAGGGFMMPQRTNKLATILTANRVPFTYRDLGTDDEARGVWRRYSNGRVPPGVVRGKDDIIGNWEEIEEANEDYKVRELIYETI